MSLFSGVTTVHPVEKSVLQSFYADAPAPGVYGGGLLVVLGDALSAEIGAQWAWLLGGDARPLAYTALGDLLFWSGRRGMVYHLEAQRGRSTPIDASVQVTFELILAEPGIQEGLLQQGRVEALLARLGPLVYGTCFIFEPWESSGGSGGADSFATGDVVVYHALAAQTVRAALDVVRGG